MTLCLNRFQREHKLETCLNTCSLCYGADHHTKVPSARRAGAHKAAVSQFGQVKLHLKTDSLKKVTLSHSSGRARPSGATTLPLFLPNFADAHCIGGGISGHSQCKQLEIQVEILMQPCPTGQQAKEDDESDIPALAVPALLKPKLKPPSKLSLRLASTGLRQELLETMQLYHVSPMDAISASEELICPGNKLVR